LLWGLPISSGLQTVVAIGTVHFFPDVDARYWIAGFGTCVVANLALLLVWFSRASQAFAWALLPLTPTGIAILSLGTGGFASPWAFSMVGLSLLWTAIAQFRARTLARIIALEICSFVIVLLAGGAVPTRDALPASGIIIFVAIVCVVSSTARDKAERQLRSSIQAQEDLKARLEEQVKERSSKIDELAIQLQNRVRERSQALAKALDGIRAREITPGSVIDGRVEVVRRIGRGGMGTVFQGKDRVTGNTVAVKLIHPGISDDAGIRRFLREAAVVSSINDPSIVRTNHLDVTEEGQLYQVMDFVNGITLQERLTKGPYEVGSAARVCALIAKALAAAHKAGVIHRDIKPANVMLTAEAPGVRVLDFGISKLINDAADLRVTEAQHIVGTPGYMSPEQIRRSADVTSATDLYSFGVVLFETLTGRRLFTGNTPGELIDAQLSGRPALAAGAHVPERLETLVTRCLDEDPRMRPDANEASAILTQIADAAGAPTTEALNELELGARAHATLDASRPA
jgi:tRNA A-37 threonylcarbamoyl transferase component Bud32